MNIEELREYCLSKKQVEEGLPFGEDTLVFKVCNKMFALTSLKGDFSVNLKCDPERAIELREEYSCITPGFHMNKKHWNTVKIDGEISNNKIKELIDLSYNLIVNKLSKKERENLISEKMETQTSILEAYEYKLSDDEISFELDGTICTGLKNHYNRSTLSLLHSFIDHTSLGSTDNEESVRKFLNRLKDSLKDKNIEPVAAVCVFPKYIELCKQELGLSGIKIACVAGGFPYVQTFKEVRELECKMAVKAGCDEIDIVIPIGEAFSDDMSDLRKDLRRMRKICVNKTLKVILETGELKDSRRIFAASIIAMEEGADFIKTSTGKVAINATPEAVYVMAYAVKKFSEKTGKMVGIKVAGGVSSSTKAIQYFSIINHVLGKEWLYNKYFRIGTSSLTYNLQQESATLN